MTRRCIALLMAWMLATTAVAQTTRQGEDQTGRLPRNPRGEPVVGPVMPASSLLGREVRTEDGKQMGTVADLAMDLDEGHVAALMVSAGGAADSQATALIPIPWKLVQSVDADKPIALKISQTSLEKAPQLKPGQTLENATRLWLATVFQHYKLEPYWQPRQQASAWGKSSDYGKLFNPERIVTVEGQIEDVTYLSPLEGMAVGTQLTLKTDEGVVKVQLGPLSHLSEQGITFKKDGRAKVEGSRIMLAGHPVIMATQVQTGDQKLHLRDRDGTVHWREWTQQDAGYVPASLKKLIGMPVRNGKGEDLGKVSDFAIASDRGLLAYVAMTCTCFDNVADKLYPVPLSAFVVQPKAEAWRLQLPLDVLENSRPYPAAKWPEKIDRGWVEYVHVRYGRSPFGGVRTQPHPEPVQK